jgi:hypothetical protein
MMSRSTVSLALFPALLFVGFASAPAFAGCNAAIVSNISPTDPDGLSNRGQITVSTAGVPAVLQHEGKAERVSDVLIYDDTAVAGGNCFTPGNRIQLNYGAVLTNPASVQTIGPNLDVFDSSGALGITAKSFSSFSANALVWVVEVDVQSAGTPATAAGGITLNPVGSAVRVKNLRFDATQLPADSNLMVSVSASLALPANLVGNVGVVRDTIAPGAGVVQEGAGLQSAGDTLSTPAMLDLTENYAGAFRVASADASGVYGDSATTATRLIFDLGTSLPTGVTVKFPALIQVGGSSGLKLALQSGGSCAGPVQCTAVYDTKVSGPNAFDLQITTAAASNTGEDGNAPAIGVLIANPSGFGTPTLTMSFVPSHLTSLGDVPVSLFSAPLMSIPQGSATLPAISAISPNTALAGSGAPTLKVTGSNFASTAVVQWNGSARSTIFVSSTQLTAVLSASDVALAGLGSVSVLSGGKLSNSVSFAITANPTSSPLQYVLPHVISGGGYATNITIVNVSTQQNNVVLNFVGQTGVTLSSTSYKLAPGATLRVGMTDTERFGAAVTKWAIVGSQASVLANVWYDYKATASSTVGNSVGFTDSAPNTDLSLPAEFNPSVVGVTLGKTVGIAIANPNAAATTATLKLVDSTGTVFATKTMSLPAWNQTAVDLSQAAWFGSVLPAANFVGSVTISATSPLSAIAVQDSDGLFSAVPVGAGRAK